MPHERPKGWEGEQGDRGAAVDGHRDGAVREEPTPGPGRAVRLGPSDRRAAARRHRRTRSVHPLVPRRRLGIDRGRRRPTDGADRRRPDRRRRRHRTTRGDRARTRVRADPHRRRPVRPQPGPALPGRRRLGGDHPSLRRHGRHRVRGSLGYPAAAGTPPSSSVRSRPTMRGARSGGAVARYRWPRGNSTC